MQMRDNHSVAAGGSECPKVIKVLACVSSVLSAINRPESKVSINYQCDTFKSR